MTRVARFSFDHGLLGQGAQSADAVGMAFDNGVVDRQQEQREAALRSDLRAHGRRRQACKPDHERRCPCDSSTDTRAEPARLMLLLLPFIVLVAVYFTGSSMRLTGQPRRQAAAERRADERRDQSVRVHRGQAHRRISAVGRHRGRASSALASGSSISAVIALVAGIVTGSIPLVSATLSPFITVISMIPPLAVLPILFIVFGLDELSKVVLIVIGITPMMIRDLQQRAREIPNELWVKAQTLGAIELDADPARDRCRSCCRACLSRCGSSLGSAWLFLIAAEAIASTDGLGYRIFLVRRYLAMDVILPYVAWITLLAWLIDEGAAPHHAMGVSLVRRRRAHDRSPQRLEGIRRSGRARTAEPAASPKANSARWSARRAAASRRSCACCSARNARRAARSCSTASRCRANRTRIAASCSSAIRCSRT